MDTRVKSLKRVYYVMKSHLKYLLRYLMTSIYCFAAQPKVQSAIFLLNKVL